MLSEEQVNEIEARHKKTTPGPWWFNSYNAICSAPLSQEHIELENARKSWTDEEWDAATWPQTRVAYIPAKHGDTGDNPSDARFIAHAWEDVQALIETVRELRRKCDSK